MKVAIFSDVHGNLPALERFVQITQDRVDQYVCLGDVVNYGPWNDQCLELVMSLPGIVLLEGNHERLFLGTEVIEHEPPLVQEFYRCSIRGFTRRDLIGSLPREYPIDGFVCTHTIGDGRVYQDTKIEVDRDYIIGHTHHAFDIRRGVHRIVNCGSVGQNRRRVDRLSYAVLDRSSGELTLHEEAYDVERLMSEFALRGYPQVCIDYYRGKLKGSAS